MVPMLVYVSISTDVTMPFIPPLITSHSFITTTVPPVSGIGMAFELPVPVMWAPGYGLFQNKLTTTVLHKMMPLALDGHNCGYMIPHVTIPPNNVLLPMHIMFSSRKMVFAASTVKANKAQVAITLVGILPMTCCANPVTLPTGAAINITNTAMVGLTFLDFLMGLMSIVATMVLDWIFRTKIANLKAPSLKGVVEKLLFPLSKKEWVKWAWKTAVGAAVSGLKILVTGDGSVSVKVGSDTTNLSLSYTKTADGWSVAASGQVAAPMPLLPGNTAGAQGKFEHSHSSKTGADTNAWSGSTAEGTAMGNAGAKQSASSSTTTDKQGNVTTKSSTGKQVVAGGPGAAYSSNQETSTTSKNGGPSTTKTTGSQGSRVLGKSWGAPL